jgi:hypothetical protein
MDELAVFPDAEKAAIDYLLPVLDAYGGDVKVGVVRGPGPHFVRVRRVGGAALTPNHDRATLDVWVWHDTDKSRMALAQHLWAAFRAAANDHTSQAWLSFDATVLGPRMVTDPADPTKAACLFTVTVITRAL